MTIGNRHISADLLAVLLLIALCWLFNWRLLTPNPINQQSFVEGDFSGQFVAFAQYQAVRLGQGEVPLWNPYNYGGHPFLADTQSAVFYPPRLITIGVLNATGGSTPQRMYAGLEVEMIAHMLLASLLMYAFVRRLTLSQPYSVVSGLVAGITFGYSGYMTGYPQLQLAVMEAGMWLPLALLAIHEATRPAKVRWHWFAVAGIALGLSLAAGHPQTTVFFGYISLAYIAWRTATQHRQWYIFVIGALIFGLIGAGLAAVQLIPGLEYTRLTVRATLGFDAMGNGFPFYDVLQMLFPGMLSLWSPLYIGIIPLALAIYAVARRVEGTIFWLALTFVALGLSFGKGTVLYDLFYNLMPGFNLFREQERSAYVIAVALSILAGLGTNQLFTTSAVNMRRYKLLLWGMLALGFILGVTLLVNWLLIPGTSNKYLGLVWFSVFISGLSIILLTDSLIEWQTLPRWRAAPLIGLVIFELFSVGRNNPNVEAKPVSERLQEPALAKVIRSDSNGVFRADLTRAIGENYGTLYGIMDTQGISPLRLISIDRLQKLPPGRSWQVFGVRYVPTEDKELPVPSTIVATDSNARTTINLHKLNDPRPFARLVYRTWIEPDDNAAFGILSDPSYDALNTVILLAAPEVTLPKEIPSNSSATITSFKPEVVTIHTSSSEAAILSLSMVYYPGWQATIDGQPAVLLRADTAMTALVVPSGDHNVELTYRPNSYLIGLIISIATIVVVALGALFGFASSLRRPDSKSVNQ